VIVVQVEQCLAEVAATGGQQGRDRLRGANAIDIPEAQREVARPLALLAEHGTDVDSPQYLDDYARRLPPRPLERSLRSRYWPRRKIGSLPIVVIKPPRYFLGTTGAVQVSVSAKPTVRTVTAIVLVPVESMGASVSKTNWDPLTTRMGLASGEEKPARAVPH
jgi:hypothetical protein